MKITINLECTPEEARAFMGLPDIKPMQETLMKEVQERMTRNIQAMDPAELFRSWLPASFEGFKQWQDMLLNRAGGK